MATLSAFCITLRFAKNFKIFVFIFQTILFWLFTRYALDMSRRNKCKKWKKSIWLFPSKTKIIYFFFLLNFQQNKESEFTPKKNCSGKIKWNLWTYRRSRTTKMSDVPNKDGPTKSHKEMFLCIIWRSCGADVVCVKFNIIQFPTIQLDTQFLVGIVRRLFFLFFFLLVLDLRKNSLKA